MADPQWTRLLVGHVQALTATRRELIEVKKAILQCRAESAQYRQSDARWKRDDYNLVQTRELLDDELDLDATVQAHELAIDVVKLFIDLDISFVPELVPPPLLD